MVMMPKLPQQFFFFLMYEPNSYLIIHCEAVNVSYINDKLLYKHEQFVTKASVVSRGNFSTVSSVKDWTYVEHWDSTNVLLTFKQVYKQAIRFPMLSQSEVSLLRTSEQQ